MLLPDVNILIYAHRRETPNHDLFRVWLEELVNGDEAYGLCDPVCTGFLRIVTHPRVFDPVSTIDDALMFIDQARVGPAYVRVAPGERHWEIFTRLCRATGARGNLIPDAYLAAVAIESGSEWITMDGDFARFPGSAGDVRFREGDGD